MQGLQIFDLGMHNGDDTAYYLHLGYSVVGVDANPLLAASCESRFATEIAAGRLKIINAGVLNQPGEFTFYRNLEDSGWSSFDPAKGQQGGKWEAITVPCYTAHNLIVAHGKPYFMKIDIEGADYQAVESIDAATAPSYLSAELSLEDPIVEALIDLGYNAFKFVDGATFRPMPVEFPNEIGWRMLRKAGRTVPAIRSAVSRLPERFRPKAEYNPPGKYSPDGYAFTAYSSGPFGENAAGNWRDPDDALRWFRYIRDGYRNAHEHFWWDVHARHSGFVK